MAELQENGHFCVGAAALGRGRKLSKTVPRQGRSVGIVGVVIAAGNEAFLFLVFSDLWTRNRIEKRTLLENNLNPKPNNSNRNFFVMQFSA